MRTDGRQESVDGRCLITLSCLEWTSGVWVSTGSDSRQLLEYLLPPLERQKYVYIVSSFYDIIACTRIIMMLFSI
jgi:hypothetical protein